jgi:hypothetical protein
MKDIVEKLTLRGLLSFFLPGAYVVGMLGTLASSCGLLEDYNLTNPGEMPAYLFFSIDSLAIGAFFFLMVLLASTIIHVLNIPERLPFYRDSMVVNRVLMYLTVTYYRVGIFSNVALRTQVHNCFFRFFDKRITAEQKNRTHMYVNLYSATVNIAAATLVIIPLSIIAYYYFDSNFFEIYGPMLVFTLLLSTLGAYGTFYTSYGIEYLFDRQQKEFVESREYQALDTYFRETFAKAYSDVETPSFDRPTRFWKNRRPYIGL